MVCHRHLANIYFLLVNILQTGDYPLCELELHLILLSVRGCIELISVND